MPRIWINNIPEINRRVYSGNDQQNTCSVRDLGLLIMRQVDLHGYLWTKSQFQICYKFYPYIIDGIKYENVKYGTKVQKWARLLVYNML